MDTTTQPGTELQGQPVHSREEIIENLRSRIAQGQADIAKIESLIHKRGVEKSINFYRSILHYITIGHE
jgi:DNA-binding protein H-NS